MLEYTSRKCLFAFAFFNCSFGLPMLCRSTNNEKMQVLWHSSCLDSLLFSVHDNTPSTVVNDPAWTAAVRSLYQKVVREWIIISLSYAPCTSQGLLQVSFFLPIHIIFYMLIQNIFMFDRFLLFLQIDSFLKMLKAAGPQSFSPSD